MTLCVLAGDAPVSQSASCVLRDVLCDRRRIVVLVHIPASPCWHQVLVFARCGSTLADAAPIETTGARGPGGAEIHHVAAFFEEFRFACAQPPWQRFTPWLAEKQALGSHNTMRTERKEHPPRDISMGAKQSWFIIMFFSMRHDMEEKKISIETQQIATSDVTVPTYHHQADHQVKCRCCTRAGSQPLAHLCVVRPKRTCLYVKRACVKQKLAQLGSKTTQQAQCPRVRPHAKTPRPHGTGHRPAPSLGMPRDVPGNAVQHTIPSNDSRNFPLTTMSST